MHATPDRTHWNQFCVALLSAGDGYRLLWMNGHSSAACVKGLLIGSDAAYKKGGAGVEEGCKLACRGSRRSREVMGRPADVDQLLDQTAWAAHSEQDSWTGSFCQNLPPVSPMMQLTPRRFSQRIMRGTANEHDARFHSHWHSVVKLLHGLVVDGNGHLRVSVKGKLYVVAGPVLPCRLVAWQLQVLAAPTRGKDEWRGKKKKEFQVQDRNLSHDWLDIELYGA